MFEVGNDPELPQCSCAEYPHFCYRHKCMGVTRSVDCKFPVVIEEPKPQPTEPEVGISLAFDIDEPNKPASIRFAGRDCPTCRVLGRRQGMLFWQSAGSFYECNEADHYFDVETLEWVLKHLEPRWIEAPPVWDEPVNVSEFLENPAFNELKKFCEQRWPDHVEAMMLQVIRHWAEPHPAKEVVDKFRGDVEM